MPATLRIVPWNDPVLDTIGHDPRSHYAESFWLPTIGPTALLLLRHLATRFDTAPGTIELVLVEASQALGLGQRDGNSSPIVRTLSRLEQFDLACQDPQTPTVAVRRHLPPVHRRHLRRLPLQLQAAHASWAEAHLGETANTEARQQARTLALVLLEQGGDLEHVERVLGTTGFHPALCHGAARWAQSHRSSGCPPDA